VLFFLFSNVGRPGRPAAPSAGSARKRKYTVEVKRDGTLTWRQGADGERRLVSGTTRITIETTAPPARVAKAVKNVKAKARGKPNELHDVIVALIIAEVV